MHKDLCFTLSRRHQARLLGLGPLRQPGSARCGQGFRRSPQTLTKLTFWAASHPVTLAQCSGSRRSHDLTA